MERCKNVSLGRAPDQQQHQQTTIADQRPFLSPTTPAWGDRNVSERSTEETNNNFGFSFIPSLDPSTPNSRFPTNILSSSSNSILSARELTENTTNSSNDATQLPRICKLCNYVVKERTEYIEHIINHCTFSKETYVGDFLKGYVDDEEFDDSGNESQNKGRKKSKVSRPKLCSKCKFTASTKLSLWLHVRQHLLQDECSGFVCVICPFATTLKHHMTFHWFSAHDDFKAFTCTRCQYACVSKSMLTSHMKTHSTVYQYNCGSCTYRTKFCNAMKKHLKDTQHVAGPVLKPDGTPDPFATIDIYSNKRGPRRRQDTEPTETTSVEDEPSFSGTIPPVSVVRTSSISSSPISLVTSDSPESKMHDATSMSPFRTTPTKISPERPSSTSVSFNHSNFLTSNFLATFNRMRDENEVDLSGNDPSANEKIPSSTTIYAKFCDMLLSDIKTRSDFDEQQCGQMLRIFCNTRKFLSKHFNSSADMIDTNGDLSDNEAMDTDEPSMLTTMDINQYSTPMTLTSEPQSKVGENVISDAPLDLSMSAMSRVKNQLQFQESVASSSSRRKNKRKVIRLEYPIISENANDDETQTQDTKKPRTELSPSLLEADSERCVSFTPRFTI
ncbi:PREDICTED: protein hunchback-like [Vollenhovia emeryi]|uniref:protein hunchback-like n=1 Tax=Vollenhovia emeryi TaxID=411798 RepID=UPI0005F4DA28|nr:PREDICTED: protein hunchback-like [Vollenhovia emeryi]